MLNASDIPFSCLPAQTPHLQSHCFEPSVELILSTYITDKKIRPDITFHSSPGGMAHTLSPQLGGTRKAELGQMTLNSLLLYDWSFSFPLKPTAFGGSTFRVEWVVKPRLPHDEVKWKSLSHVQLFATPSTLQSMEFSRTEYWSGEAFPFSGDLPNPVIEPRPPALQVDSLPAYTHEEGCLVNKRGRFCLLQGNSGSITSPDRKGWRRSCWIPELSETSHTHK